MHFNSQIPEQKITYHFEKFFLPVISFFLLNDNNYLNRNKINYFKACFFSLYFVNVTMIIKSIH